MNNNGRQNIKQVGSKVVVSGIENFDPVHIFECGQCFRWNKQQDHSYTGVAKGRVVNVKYNNAGTKSTIEFSNTSVEEFMSVWFEYFDLGTDYSNIADQLSKKDGIMKEAVKFGNGIRLLKQDSWETLISFIISANNFIPKIMRTVNRLSQLYGQKILDFDGSEHYSFPDVNSIVNSNIESLAICGAGFRCKYIFKTARDVKDEIIDLDKIGQMGTENARNELMKFYGVGPKVADCVLLYSGIKYNVFPTDVWIKRVIEKLYFGRTATLKEIKNFSTEYFGDLAGYAQQYLFYYAREKGRELEI